MRINLIVNTSEKDELEQLREGVERLRREGHEVSPRVTFEGGDARRMAREAAAGGAALVVAAGGDGTINEAANGLQQHAEQGGATPRLALIPLGTGNDLAAALEIPAEIPAALEIAVGGRSLEVDVPRVDDRCFLNVSTGGFGAEATEEAPAEAKRALGSLAYIITGARKFVELRSSVARFSAEETLYDGPFLLYAVGNSRRTGGGNWLTPRADLSDGLLDLCIVREMSRMEFVKLLPELRTGNHLDHPGVLYRQVPHVVVEAQSGLSVNVDGEPLPERRRLEYRFSPHRLTLAVP